MSPKLETSFSERSLPSGRAGTTLLPARLEFWNRFHRLAEAQVRECNALAGQDLWETECQEQPTLRLKVRSTTCRGDELDFCFDAHTGILTCQPGARIERQPCRFELVSPAGEALRHGEFVISLKQAVLLMLDELVFVDEQ
jgi:hypothetical protein